VEAVDPLVARVLDELAPPRPAPDRWEAIAATARRRRRRVWLFAPLIAMAAGALVLAWPFGGTRGTLLQRAAAALGDGPILHVVVDQGYSGTQIDLATGAQTVVHGREELWYDPARGVRDVTTFAGVPQGDVTYPPGRVSYLDRTLAFLATDYRRALKDGTARVLGDDTIDGAPVTWIRVTTQFLPDVADRKEHEWAHDVAVDRNSLKPVATRETRDGVVGPDGISRIDSVESLPSGAVTITPESQPPTPPMAYSVTGSLTPAEASAVLGAPLVSAGDSLDGLALTRIAKQLRREGSVTHTGLTLFYGPPAGGGMGQPPPDGPYVHVNETLTLDEQFQQGVRGYSPPDGMLLVFGKTIGVMQAHGVHIALNASSGTLLLDAAHALAR
jgi:hypothetical protein